MIEKLEQIYVFFTWQLEKSTFWRIFNISQNYKSYKKI